MAESIGDRIRAVRGSVSQDEFAVKLGVHKETIGKYERDKVVPGGDVLARLRETCGVNINWLLTGEGSGPEGVGTGLSALSVDQLQEALSDLMRDQRRVEDQFCHDESHDLESALFHYGITDRKNALIAEMARRSVPARFSPQSEIDPILYGRVTEAVAAVYKELGYTVVLHQVAAEAARIAIELTGMEFTEDERPVVIKGAMAALRSRLRESLSHPDGEAAGKRPA